MTLTPFLCNLSSVFLEMFRSSGAENRLLQPAFAGDYSSCRYVLKTIHWTKWWNGCMVSRLGIFCVIQPNTLQKDGKLCSISMKGVKIQKMLNNYLKHAYLSFRLMREVKIVLPLCFFSFPRKSIFVVNWDFPFPEVIPGISRCVVLDHTGFAALPLWRAFLSMGLKCRLIELSR